MKTLIIYKSIHLGSTKKIAETIGRIMDADVMEPNEFDISKFDDYELIGFGSGIYDDGFHKAILDLVDKLPNFKTKRVFLFSTAGMIYEKSHSGIREKLTSKNAVIVDEFYCKGLNKNSFLKHFGGMNKGRPNSDDIKNAEQFAASMIEEVNLT